VSQIRHRQPVLSAYIQPAHQGDVSRQCLGSVQVT
jgi:hypothetical protein